jgi:hypothetical protein
MSTVDSRQASSQLRRLQTLLMLMVLWNLLAFAAELTFGSPLFRIDDDRIGGFLAARGSFSGAMLVPVVLYLYALARNPLRQRGIIWCGVLEQAAAALLAVYHVAARDIQVEGMVLPLIVSLVLLVLLLINMPRAQAQF